MRSIQTNQAFASLLLVGGMTAPDAVDFQELIGDLLHLLTAGFGPTRKRLRALRISGYWGIAAVIFSRRVISPRPGAGLEGTTFACFARPPALWRTIQRPVLRLSVF
jgi:hypothetical protein